MTLPASRAGAGFVAGVREGASVSEEKKRMKRQAEDDKRARLELRDLVGRDRGKTPGGEYLERARLEREKRDPGTSKKRRKNAEDGSSDGDTGEGGSKDKKEHKPAIQSVFKAEALRRIGFNPTAKPGELARDESAEAKAYRVSSPPFSSLWRDHLLTLFLIWISSLSKMAWRTARWTCPLRRDQKSVPESRRQSRHPPHRRSTANHVDASTTTWTMTTTTILSSKAHR